MAKKLTGHILSAVMFCFLSTALTAQPTILLPPNQPEQDACTALSICGNTFFTPYSYQGNGAVYDLSTTPCNSGFGPSGEFNSVWFKLHVTTGGKILFSIIPVDPLDDYDFVVLNVTNGDCNNLQQKDIVRCNFNNNLPGNNKDGIVGLNLSSSATEVENGAFGGSFCSNLDAVAGETYLIMLNNFGHDEDPGPSKGFTLDFRGTTASFSPIPAPGLGTANTPVCSNATSVTLQLTRPVFCNSVAADGSDFIITPHVDITGAFGVNCQGSTGYANAITVQFAGSPPPGAYTLSARKGSDNNTVLGLCNAQLQLPDGLTFTVAQPIKAVDSQFICYSQLPYLWNGIKVNKGGSRAASFTTASVRGCDSTVSLNLTVSPPPVISNIAKTICAGQVYNLPWDGSTVNKTGTYTHTYSSNAGCDSFISTVALTVDNPSKTIQDIICRDSTKQLTLGAGYSNYVWYNGAATPSISITQPGSYTVTATDAFNCVAADTLSIATDPVTITLAKNIPLCQGTTLVINGPAGFTGYLWNDGSTNQSLSVSSPGNYWLLVKDAYTCPAADTTSVIPEPLPAGFLPATVTKCFYNTVLLKPANNFNKYLWGTGETTPTLAATAAGTFTLQVTDANGCVGTSAETVIDSACAEYLYMPTAFSPNGDSHNDVFKPVFAGLAIQYNFIVYNRWGHKVFESNNPATGWDGTINGQQQPPGVYVWICRYQLARLQLVSQKGTVVLVR